MTTPLRSSPVLIMRWCSGGAWRVGWRRATPRGVDGCAPGCYQSQVATPGSGGEVGASCLSAHDEWVAGEARQRLDEASPSVDVDEILDPDPGHALEVDAGFDREDRGA